MSKSKPTLNQQYQTARIARVCDYIAAHLDDDLPLARLCRVAHCSPYHFHRLFTAHVGTGLFAYTQLLRLKRASYQLVFRKDMKIIAIALDAHFASPEAFARTFKRTFGQTPSQFRRQPDWPGWHRRYIIQPPQGVQTMQVKLIDFAATKIAVLEHQGAPERLNASVERFISWRKTTQLSPVKSKRTFGIAYSNPRTTAPEAFRFDVCGEVEADVPANPQGIITKTIPSGRCAVIRHRGSRDHMEEPIMALYREWLPTSGYELRDFPLFFEYRNFFPNTPESELITDIYLPLK